MSTFIIENCSCGYCSKEYMESHSKDLVGMPDDMKKMKAIHKVIHGANKFSNKPCVKIVVGINETHICADHLYKMIDAVKEYEDNGKEKE